MNDRDPAGPPGPEATAAAVSSFVRHLWGKRAGEALGESEGVLHVAAVWQDPERRTLPGVADELIVMKIEEGTPRSASDLFSLGVARARADAILATGAILRSERELSHDLAKTGASGPALVRWRREVVGLSTPPRLAILTSGRDLDPRHPALHGEARPLLLVPRDRLEAVAARLREAGADGWIEVCGLAAPDGVSALETLAGPYGCRRVSVEAGPSTVAPLYRGRAASSGGPPRLGLVQLSTYLEPGLPGRLWAGAIPGRESLGITHEPIGGSTRTEESGRWKFELWSRR